MINFQNILGISGIEIYKKILVLNNINDFIFYVVVLFFGYSFKFLLLSSIFEYFNPSPKNEKRTAKIYKEAYLSIICMFFHVLYVTFWLWKIEPLLSTHDYFLHHEYTLKDFLLNMITYLFFMVGKPNFLINKRIPG
jgi:hypothetical protein